MSLRRSLPAAALALSITAACGSSGVAPAAVAPPRESGQSKLMDSTFAGQNRCNAKSHERPFVVEWDATDMSSFQARTNNDVVFVKYEGCTLTVIDSCSDDSVRGALGSYKPVDWTGGAVEKVDIGNAIDLYAKLPLGAALLGGRVEAGEKFHMEYFVSGTRSATRPVIYASDLAKIPGCAGVTHFVYGINLGAYVLASESKSSASASATVLGAGGGGGTSHSSAIEKKAGELASCRSDSAKELDSCKTPIRLTLREITAGENPVAVAERAPEEPTALNLAGQLQVRSDKERAAGEHTAAAQTKLAAGDGRGCVAELDLHDRLDPRPAALSTNPKGLGGLRALCVMASGQCAAGREMARKAMLASGTQQKPEDIDRNVDGSVANYCRGGLLTDRDRLLIARSVLMNSNVKRTPAECQKAYDEATKLVATVSAPSTSDALYDTWHAISMNGPLCFARAGDCVSAWRVSKEQDVIFTKHYTSGARSSSPSGQRGHMMSATNDLCIDKPQGTLTDQETVLRAVAELASTHSANPPSAAFCSSRIDKAIPALKRALVADTAGDLKYEALHLQEKGAECLAAANDCETAWKKFSEVAHAFPEKHEHPDWTLRRRFRDKAKACQWKPQGPMTPREKVLWAAGNLEDGSRDSADAKQCLAALDVAKRTAGEDHGDKAINTEWHYATRDIARNVGRCLQKAGDCGAAFSAYKSARATFDDGRNLLSSDPAKQRQSFESDVSDCKGH